MQDQGGSRGNVFVNVILAADNLLVLAVVSVLRLPPLATCQLRGQGLS